LLFCISSDPTRANRSIKAVARSKQFGCEATGGSEEDVGIVFMLDREHSRSEEQICLFCNFGSTWGTLYVETLDFLIEANEELN